MVGCIYAEAGDNVKVTLSAAGYNEDGASAEGTLAIVIPSGKLKGLSRNTNYILYSSNPQNKQNPDNQIASFMTNNNSTNSSDILITQPVGNDRIYIRYTKNGRYNVASFSLSDALDNDGVTFNNRSWTEYK